MSKKTVPPTSPVYFLATIFMGLAFLWLAPHQTQGEQWLGMAVVVAGLMGLVQAHTIAPLLKFLEGMQSGSFQIVPLDRSGGASVPQSGATSSSTLATSPAISGTSS